MEHVTVYTASDRVEAETVSALLRSNGIPALVAADDTGGTSPNLAFIQGIPVKVTEGQADAARQVLDRN